MSVEVWHRGYLISPAYFGYNFEHPAFDPENPSDWRYGTGNSVEECKGEIDRLLEEDAEWDEAVRIVKAMLP